jgi:hypothetical protein
VSGNLVVDGGTIECADSWPQEGDCEGAVVWILLVAPEEPGLYNNEGVASGIRIPPGFWTISPFCLVERSACLRRAVLLPICLVLISSFWIRFCLRQAVVVAFESSVYPVVGTVGHVGVPGLDGGRRSHTSHSGEPPHTNEGAASLIFPARVVENSPFYLGRYSAFIRPSSSLLRQFT